MRTGGHAEASRNAFLVNQVNQLSDASADRDATKNGQQKRARRERVREFVNMPSVRTDTHTYAVAESGRGCLYDNVADPFQTHNLVGEPAQRALMEALDAEIVAWLRQSNDPFPYAEAVTGIANFPT